MRKGQLTLFIILGLVALVIVGVVIMLPSGNKVKSEQSEQDKALVTEYVQGCLQTSAKETLKSMGTHGGFVNTDAFKHGIDQRDTQVIQIPEQEIVLWHEIHPCAENPAGCMSNNRPPLCAPSVRNCPVATDKNTNPKIKSIQEQLEQETSNQVVACTQFATVFPDLIITPKGEAKVIATIREDSIAIDMNYPLDIIASDKQKVSINKFSTKLDVKLPALYRFAAKVQTAESQLGFLENIFLHLHSIYSGSKTELPPIREVQLFGRDTNMWFQPAVKDIIEKDLLPFMNFVQIVNAKESYVPLDAGVDDPAYRSYAEGAYRYMAIKLDDEIVPYSVQVEYPGTPMYLSINGGKNPLKPNTFGGAAGDIFGTMTGIRFTQYRFKYDLAFPVIIHVTDTSAFSGEGFNLDFGLEANIKNNYPLNVSANITTVRNSGGPEIDLTDPLQLVNHIYKIQIKDKHTGTPVSNAAVYFECNERYYMGDTSADGTWLGKMPYCLTGGAIQVQAKGYMGTGKLHDNAYDDGLQETVFIDIWPIRSKYVMIYKRNITNFDNLTSDVSSGVSTQQRSLLEPYDLVIAQIARIPDTPFDEEIPLIGVLRFGNISSGDGKSDSSSAAASLLADLKLALQTNIISKDEYDQAVQQLQDAQKGSSDANKDEPLNPEDIQIISTAEIDMVPGKYTFDATLIHNKQVEIPYVRKCECVLSVPDPINPTKKKCMKEACVDLEAKNFTSWISGGNSFTAENPMVFTEDDIYSTSNITLYVAEQPIPTNWDEMMAVQELSGYLTYGRQNFVKPEINR